MAIDKVQASARVNGVTVNGTVVVSSQQSAIVSVNGVVNTAAISNINANLIAVDETTTGINNNENVNTKVVTVTELDAIVVGINDNTEKLRQRVSSILTALRNHGLIAS